MKLGIILGRFTNKNYLDYSRFGDDCYKKIKEHGYDFVDFNMGTADSIAYEGDWADLEPLLIKEKQLIKEAGLEISQTHGPWRWPPRDAVSNERELWKEKMKRAIRITSFLGCKYCVLHPIFPFTDWDMNFPYVQETYDLNLEFFKDLLQTAILYDVTICYENMPMKRFSLATPEQILKLVKEINDEHFQICLDTGHVNVFDDLNVADEIRRLGKHIKVLHVHDNKYGYDMHSLPKFGTIKWDEVIKALKDINFDGVFSLECSPPVSLSDEAFEEVGKTLNKIARSIING